MLREEDIRTDVGRCVGGSFLRVIHIPTGISRCKRPLRGANQRELVYGWLREIEAELLERGLTEHIVADDPTAWTRRFRR